MTAVHRPFSCGTQYLDWSARNCERCAKSSWLTAKDPKNITVDDLKCEIERAVAFDAMIGDGSVPESIAERMGYLDNSPPRAEHFALTWDCKERETRPPD